MTPEARRFLEKAEKLLSHADTMLGVNLNEDAGRTAYLAAFHAAQAFIFEHLRKVLKTHRGVQTEFLRLTKDDERLDRSLRSFLRETYDLKSIADYETGPGAEVPAEQAAQAVAVGKSFVARIAGLIESPAPGPSADREQR